MRSERKWVRVGKKKKSRKTKSRMNKDEEKQEI